MMLSTFPLILRRKTDINVLRNCQKNINYIVKIIAVVYFRKKKEKNKRKNLAFNTIK